MWHKAPLQSQEALGPHHSMQHLIVGIPTSSTPTVPAIGKSIWMGEVGRGRNRAEGGEDWACMGSGPREGAGLRRPIGAAVALLGLPYNAPLPLGDPGSGLGGSFHVVIAAPPRAANHRIRLSIS